MQISKVRCCPWLGPPSPAAIHSLSVPMLPNDSAMDCEIPKDIYVSPSEDDHNQDVEMEENEEISVVDI